MNQNFQQWLNESGEDFKYTGDYELSLEEFPMVENFAKEGQTSNIITQHFSVGKDPNDKYPAVLVPSMYKGDWRPEKDMRHYETKGELERADKIIHEWFNELERRGRKSIPLEKNIINNLKEL